MSSCTSVAVLNVAMAKKQVVATFRQSDRKPNIMATYCVTSETQKFGPIKNFLATYILTIIIIIIKAVVISTNLSNL